MPLKFYFEGDANPNALTGQRVAVIGYGNLGRSLALNLRDSGVPVIVGNTADAYRDQALADGFAVCSIAEAAAAGDVAFVLLPDAVIADCCEREVNPALRRGSALCFASGYALTFGLVAPPPDADVIILAPRLPGELVRGAYLDGTGFVSCLSVEADVTGAARSRLLALAHAVGALRRGAFELPASDETLLDLLVEQTVGVYLGLGIQLAFSAGVAAGLPAEALVLELYMSGELARTLESFAAQGLFTSISRHSKAALYGGFIRTSEIDGAALEAMFLATLADIRDGGFARRLREEMNAGAPTISAIQEILDAPGPIPDAEASVRQALGFGRH